MSAQRATADVLVLGGGIIGAALAQRLSTLGADVLLLEAGSCGNQGATAAGMGHLVVMDDNPAELALSAWSCALWREWTAQDPQAHEYSRCGTLWIAADAEEMQAARAKAQLLQAHGVACELLDEAALREAEPQLRHGLAGGLRVCDDGIVYAPKSVSWLLAHSGPRLRLRQGQAVKLLWDAAQPARAIGVACADGSQIHAAQVVLANGMGVLQLAPELPLRAKQGMLAITDRYPGWVRHQLVELAYIKNAHASSGDSVAFNVQPRPSGQMMIGSSRQYDRQERSLNHALLGQMLRLACSFLPQLAQLNIIRCWSGVRCASPDGLPLLGPHPRHPGLWLACGHEGLGVTTAPASAHLLAAQIMQLPCELNPQDYAPARFDALAPALAA
ncbi:FAD-dependent oxidoreductase [Massilia sp. W12]|uniref:NAD(P)/FAD-dependent oxidoreductase n=1 Tax=Massilia sp. W12 TaxID=3126507 RepID=UPI0030CAC742